MLNLSELRVRKRTLEEEIARLIEEFELQTGVVVDHLITLERQQVGSSSDEQVEQIKVDVHLDV